MPLSLRLAGLRRVVHGDEKEAASGSSWAGSGAVALVQDLGDGGWGDATGGGIYEGADEIADHVVEEAGTGDAIDEDAGFFSPARAMDRAGGGAVVAAFACREVRVGGGEAGEVVSAQDVRGGLVGEREGEGPGTVPGVGGEGGGTDAVGLRRVCGDAAEDAIFVGLGESRVTGVKVGWGVAGGENADRRWEGAVQGAEEIGWRDGGGEVEGGDLGEGVDACVSAAGALGEGRLACDPAEGGGECALDGGEGGLNLPSVEGRSVVGEGEFPALHRFPESTTLRRWYS